jgi:hypothetical protein
MPADFSRHTVTLFPSHKLDYEDVPSTRTTDVASLDANLDPRPTRQHISL